ncbi:MAG TPA: hypothetical protein VJQ08_01710 [Candidatus Dormibacteraeota bacterium]|nr:hypothetical protein [Candidatus Dormibacteraeota bacterium]
MSDSATTTRPRRWGWVVLIVGLAVVGILLALADIAAPAKWPNPLGDALVGPAVVKRAVPLTVQHKPVVFERNDLSDRFAFDPKLAGFGPINPYLALRVFLTNGAGLVLLALAGLILVPARARNAVERLEARYGAPIALGAGLVMVLLTVASIGLLRFTLVFLAFVPIVLFVALLAALFGIACISLAIGRLLHRRLRLPDVHPLIASLAGALVVFDLAALPYAGVFALAAVAMAGLGLAVVTRFGSASGWSFSDLNW